MGGVSHVGKLNLECNPMAFTRHFLFLVNPGLIFQWTFLLGLLKTGHGKDSIFVVVDTFFVTP